MIQQTRLDAYQAVQLREFVLLQVFHLGLLLASLKLSLVFLFWDVSHPLSDRPISGSKDEFHRVSEPFFIQKQLILTNHSFTTIYKNSIIIK